MSDKKITIEEVKHIAKLSKLNIPDNELKYYLSEMDKMINHFNILSKVDTSDVQPMTHVNTMTNVYRQDEPKDSLTTKEALKNSSETFGQFIKIPKIID
mgnify:FL=1|tara:strand:- start:2190 stop:2486 length:297 start_codon:yes stop_codon:yes gene_type:complete